MVEERRQLPRCLLPRAVSTLATWLAALIAIVGHAPAHGADDVIRLSEAPSRGRSTSGPRGRSSRVTDQAAGGDVLKLDYTIPQGAAAGIYAKSFPGGLDADRVDVVRLAAKAASPTNATRSCWGRNQGKRGCAAHPLADPSDWAPSRRSSTGRRSGR